MITKDMAKVSKTCLSLAEGTAHTLIAGTTGSGKSVLLHDILYSLLKKGIADTESIPCFVLIDTKRVELKQYKPLKSLVVYESEPENVVALLDRVINAMDKRFEDMPGKETTEPHVYIVIDELADLLDTAGVLDRIVKIGRLGRAAHFHLLCCTQDPSRNTLSARLMQNFTTCVALRCKTDIESRQIIGIPGAESLPKHGKAIVSDPDGYNTIEVPLIPDKDIDDLVAFVKSVADGCISEEDEAFFEKVAENPAESVGAIW